MNYKPVIVAVGYNRRESLKRLLDSLENAFYPEDVCLIISIDYGGPRDVLDLANEFMWSHGEKKVRGFEQNQGLRKHVISCYDFSIEYGAAIVFEDDIFVSPYYYLYAQKAWEFYSSDKRVISLALYSQKWNSFANRRFEPINCGKDVYCSKKNASWGQCVIGTQWKCFKEWYEEHEDNLPFVKNLPAAMYKWDKSWCKYFNAYLALHEKYIITPYVSLATNFNDAGTHMQCNSNVFQQPLIMGDKNWNFAPIEELPMYDSFSENIQLADFLKQKYNKTVCIDYYGIRNNRTEYELCLSTAILPYEIYDEYGLEMKPYELNVMYNIAGYGIYLYNMNKPKKKKKNWKQHFRIIKYDVADLQPVEALFYWLYLKLKGER